jgi:hypothetical protein
MESRYRKAIELIECEISALISSCRDLSSISALARDAFTNRGRIIQRYLCCLKGLEVQEETRQLKDFVASNGFSTGIGISLSQAEISMKAFINDVLSDHSSTDTCTPVDFTLRRGICVKLPDTWQRGNSIDFDCEGVKYRTTPPSDCVPGEVLEFNPSKKTLVLVNSSLSMYATLLSFRAHSSTVSMRDSVSCLVHLFLIMIVAYSKFDAAVISVCIIVAIFCNLGGESKSGYSAYSVFNKGFRRLLGEAQPEQVEQQLRGGVRGYEADSQDAGPAIDLTNFPSKFINRPCPCGSGLKAKKCHASKKPPESREVGVRKSARQGDYDYTGFEVLRQ